MFNVKVYTNIGESRWYCDVQLFQEEDKLKILENNSLIVYDLADLKQIKIRPFYHAACIGNKNLIFRLQD